MKHDLILDHKKKGLCKLELYSACYEDIIDIR